MRNTETNQDDYTRIDEVLEIINSDPSLLEPGKPYAYQKGSTLEKVFKMAVLKEYKMLLPESEPPYRRMTNLNGVNNEYLFDSFNYGKMDVFINPNMKNSVREREFIDLLENIDSREADIVLLIKNQKLLEKYPNITIDVLVKTGYLPEEARELEAKDSVSKSKEEDRDNDSKDEVTTVETDSQENTATPKRVRRTSKASQSGVGNPKKRGRPKTVKNDSPQEELK